MRLCVIVCVSVCACVSENMHNFSIDVHSLPCIVSMPPVSSVSTEPVSSAATSPSPADRPVVNTRGGCWLEVTPLQ